MSKEAKLLKFFSSLQSKAHLGDSEVENDIRSGDEESVEQNKEDQIENPKLEAEPILAKEIPEEVKEKPKLRPSSPQCIEDQKEFNWGMEPIPYEESKNDLVLSGIRPHGKCSFMMGSEIKKKKKTAPPPIYLKHSDIRQTRDLTMDDILNGIAFPPKGGYQCVDKNVLDRQKGLFAEVIAQVLKCVFTGQPISGISLPVRVFEPRSQLERMLDIFGYVPHYFTQAASTKNKLERLKLVMTCVVAGMYGSAKQLKPFNPLLGQTYQGYFKDGTRIFCEHTSHHPPITNFLFQGPKMEDGQRMWELSGFYEYTGNKDGKSFKIGQKGPNRLTFYDGHKIEWVNPIFKLSVRGPRYMNYVGDITFWDVDDMLKGTLIFDSSKKGGWKKTRTGKKDDFAGLIYKIDQSKFEKYGFHKKKIYEWDHPKNLGDIKDKGEEVSAIQGSWLREIAFDGKKYWQIDNKDIKLEAQICSKDPLPSDWRFREDLIWLKHKNEPYADIWKKELEKMQRQDRKWRNSKKSKKGR